MSPFVVEIEAAVAVLYLVWPSVSLVDPTLDIRAELRRTRLLPFFRLHRGSLHSWCLESRIWRMENVVVDLELATLDPSETHEQMLQRVLSVAVSVR